MPGDNEELQNSSGDQSTKIQALRDMIQNAERTIQGARAILLQLEGKKKTGRPRKSDSGDAEGTVVQGTFDGQFMIGTDGKQYPVPANYASKSKLVEGDMLKLAITPDGSFIYKQIGPVERKHVIGIVAQDENGNYQIVADGTLYRVLLASVTYFKLAPGDEVAILLPRDIDATWAAIENVLQKGALVPEEALEKAHSAITANEVRMNTWKDELRDTPAPASDSPAADATESTSILDEWIHEMESLEKEIEEQKEKEKAKTEI